MINSNSPPHFLKAPSLQRFMGVGQNPIRYLFGHPTVVVFKAVFTKVAGGFHESQLSSQPQEIRSRIVSFQVDDGREAAFGWIFLAVWRVCSTLDMWVGWLDPLAPLYFYFLGSQLRWKRTAKQEHARILEEYALPSGLPAGCWFQDFRLQPLRMNCPISI